MWVDWSVTCEEDEAGPTASPAASSTDVVIALGIMEEEPAESRATWNTAAWIVAAAAAISCEAGCLGALTY